jgi:hypothetical protein
LIIVHTNVVELEGQVIIIISGGRAFPKLRAVFR